jgi:uncharacterized protein (TIGR02996 family)
MTTQIREVMIYHGHEREILAIPMTGCQVPVPRFPGGSTGCWRGYLGTWEVRDDALHLVRLVPPDLPDALNRLSAMFRDTRGSVEATWFSGLIISDRVSLPAERPDRERFLQEVARHWTFTVLVYRGKVLLDESTEMGGKVSLTRLTRHVADLFPPEECGFLRAINADVGDPTAKRVYADWLEEHGDPRAGVLRAEVDRSLKEGGRRRDWSWELSGDGPPSGFVDPEDRVWYWRQLADIPDLPPSKREGLHRPRWSLWETD